MYVSDRQVRWRRTKMTKEILKEKNVTTVTLARLVGITQPNMSNIVNWKSNPSVETLENIAKALSVPVSELFQKDCELYGLVSYQGTTYKIETKEQLMALVEAVNQEKKGSN